MDIAVLLVVISLVHVRADLQNGSKNSELYQLIKQRLSSMMLDDGDDGDTNVKPTYPNLASLPGPVQDRIKALKNLQLQTVQAETDYHWEVYKLEMKYQNEYDRINAKRAEILNGLYEPSGPEIEWKDTTEKEEPQVHKEEMDLDKNAKGIPKFWMYALRNLGMMVEPHDEPVLEHLTDITVTFDQPTDLKSTFKYLTGMENKLEHGGFTLNFQFSENPYLEDRVLVKEYGLRLGPDPEAPFHYHGPEIVSCWGSNINWKPGMDVTKKAENSKKKEQKVDSFFNFFSPLPESLAESDEQAELSEEEEMAVSGILGADFQQGLAIKEKLLPRAVGYFTGEMINEDDDEEDDLLPEKDDIPAELSEEKEMAISGILGADFQGGLAVKEKLLPRAVGYFTGEIIDDEETEDDLPHEKDDIPAAKEYTPSGQCMIGPDGRKICARPYTIKPLKIGCEAFGIDLSSKVIPKDIIEVIKKDVTDHRILVFRNQKNISPERHLEIGRWFGDIESTFYNHPKSPLRDIFRVSNDKSEGYTNVGRTGWHIDGSFQDKPFSHSLYHIINVPSAGTTSFAPLTQIVESLDQDQRDLWDRLWMVSEGERAVHPLIYRHPATGLPVLCIHLGTTKRFVLDVGSRQERELNSRQSRQILNQIQKEFTRDPDRLYHHKYSEGDFIISDNLAVGHEASPETQLPPEQVGLRVMHRVTIAGKHTPRK